MRHSERAMQSSLEAADRHATSLQHRVAQAVAESCRLHQLLFDTQQCLEGTKAEKTILTGRLGEIEDQSKKAHLTKKKVRTYHRDRADAGVKSASLMFRALVSCAGNRGPEENRGGKVGERGASEREAGPTYERIGGR